MMGTIKGLILAVAAGVPFFTLVIWPDIGGALFFKVCGTAVVLAAVATITPNRDKDHNEG